MAAHRRRGAGHPHREEAGAGSARPIPRRKPDIGEQWCPKRRRFAGPDGQAYKARQVTFQTQLLGETANDATAAGVRVSNISEDQSPGRRVLDPKHPQADADGYVTYSNVNTVEEMVNMISASRSYQNNVEVMNTSKELMLATLKLGS